MDIQKQVCNQKLSERLKELGVMQESLFYYTDEKWGIMPKKSIDFSGSPTSAFTCAELVQMNENIFGIDFSDRHKKFYTLCLNNEVRYFETFADSLAAKLIQAIKNGWITIDIVNVRLLS